MTLSFFYVLCFPWPQFQVDGDSSDDPNYHIPAIVIGEDVGLDDNVIKAFTTAVNCWQLINSRDTYKKGVKSVLKHSKNILCIQKNVLCFHVAWLLF